MARLNEEFNGALDTAIAIFNDHHPKKPALIGSCNSTWTPWTTCSGQFLHVAGRQTSERIIVLAVEDNELVVEEKGLLDWKIPDGPPVDVLAGLSAPHGTVRRVHARDRPKTGQRPRSTSVKYTLSRLAHLHLRIIGPHQFFADEAILDQFCCS